MRSDGLTYTLINSKNIGVFVLLSTMFLLFGCSNDDVDYPTEYRYVDILTIIKNDQGMILEKVGVNDRGIVKMTSMQWVDAELEKGRRVIAEYGVVAENLSQHPMPIKLYQIGYIQFDTIKFQPLREIENSQFSNIEIVSLWRTGDFINMQAEIGYDGKSQSYTISADETTFDQPIVECYLLSKGELINDKSIYRHSYGSFYVGEIWNSPTFERIRLYIPRGEDEKYYIDIAKNPY